jgi:hypothetical protein
MTPRVGKCTNYSGCKLANRNKKIAVVTSDFRCPECGSSLELVGRKQTTLYTLLVLIGLGTVLLFLLANFEVRKRQSGPPEVSDKLPTFFPPRATDSLTLPLQLAGERLTLENLSNRLKDALHLAGYFGKCSYFWLDDRHGPGFAIVTHIEHIQPNGNPVLESALGFRPATVRATYADFDVKSFNRRQPWALSFACLGGLQGAAG